MIVNTSFQSMSSLPNQTGSIWAELGQKISVNDLEEHAKTHRPFPSPTPFPRQPSKILRDTSASYVKKIPELREFLIEVAEKKETKNVWGSSFYL